MLVVSSANIIGLTIIEALLKSYMPSRNSAGPKINP